MDEERLLLDYIAANPTDRVAQSGYADWLAERGRAEEMAWRWIAAFRRRPVPFKLMRIDSEPYWIARQNSFLESGEADGYGWASFREGGYMRWPEMYGYPMLPSRLFKWLPRCRYDGEDWPFSTFYDGVQEAFAALVTAYCNATRPRRGRLDRLLNGRVWVPDWSLVSQVPDEDRSEGEAGEPVPSGAAGP